jgi:V/A-type H+-transporting ATPase subunit I
VIHFYSLTNIQYEKITDEEFHPLLVKKQAEQTYFARIISNNEQDNFTVEALEIPTEGITSLEKEKAKITGHLAQAKEDLKTASSHAKALANQTLDLQDRLKKERILETVYHTKSLDSKHLKCWFNVVNEISLKQLLDNSKCAYRISQPSLTDPVPVLLSNNKFNQIFEPITKIFQLPHYFEFDLTPFIAVFYPILFAYCLGDAGYGFLVSTVALVGYFSFLKSQRSLALLGLILGLTTLVMGFIKSGSLFGIALLESSSLPWVRQLSNLVLIPDNSDYFFNAFNVALLIGLLQILVGIGIAVFKTWSYQGFLPALAQIGKMIIVISSVSLFLKDTLLLDESMMLSLKISLGAGVLMVMLFHDMSQHIFSRLGSSVLPLFFIFTGLLGDVLSYVRLFALGVTSGVLGLVVNQIGTDMMGDSWYSYVGAIAFLIFGHGLNLALAVLGSFIHPLRLTFVEFYNNAQFEGGGKAFEAYSKSIKID